MRNGPDSPSNPLRTFLDALDPHPEAAAEKFLRLREKIVKLAVWRGCPESFADEIADIVIDRMAGKVNDGLEIGNIGAYAAQVLKFVLLERQRKNKEDAAGDDLPEIAVQPVLESGDEPELRLQCLRKCLAEVAADDRDRSLILSYYDLSSGGTNKENRKRLAADLGLTPTNLKVKACRIRDRLERCINECVEAAAKKSRK